MLCLVHGDDFVRVGEPGQLRWLKDKLNMFFEIKTTEVGCRGYNGEVKEARILNRVIRVHETGLEYEADQRHVDLIIQKNGAHGMSAFTHPGGREKGGGGRPVAGIGWDTGDEVQSSCRQGEFSGSRPA